jgi:beta-glucosidase
MEGYDGLSTQFPSAIAIAASWDVDVVYEWGAAMGKEFYDKGAQAHLGPGLNIKRMDSGNGNFDYLSGEDPYLGYVLSQPAVKGIQDQNVMAVVRHFVNND